MNQLWFAWFAGIIDGEGTISIHRQFNEKYGQKSPSHSIRLSFEVTHEGVVKYVYSELGGCIFKRGKKSASWRESYRWSVSGKRAISIIKEIAPYLRIKNKQAVLAIEFSDLVGHKGWKKKNDKTGRVIRLEDGIVLKRELLYEEMKNLNMRGNVIVN